MQGTTLRKNIDREEFTFRKLSKEIAEGSTTVSDTDVFFRPGIDLKDMLATLKYEKVK